MDAEGELNDAQHARLVLLLPTPSNHLKIPHRQVLDAWRCVLYLDCTWRGLLREFGKLPHDLCAAQPLGQGGCFGTAGGRTAARSVGRS